jgi:predicted nucleic acid-binding protein
VKISIVVDANHLIAALIGGVSREVLFDRRFEFIASEFTLNEVKKYIPMIAKKSGVSKERVHSAFSLLPIKWYPRKFYQDKLSRGDLLPTAKAVGLRVSSDVFPLVAEAVFHRKLARFATLGPFTIEHGSRQGFIHPAFWLGQLDDPFIRVQPGGSGHRPFTTTRSAGHRSVVWRPIGDLHSDSRLPKRKCCIRDISFSESASGTLFIPRLKHVGFLARFRSKKLIAYKDVKDVDVLALSLATRSHLWSEDKHFEGIKEIRLLRTKDLI